MTNYRNNKLAVNRFHLKSPFQQIPTLLTAFVIRSLILHQLWNHQSLSTPQKVPADSRGTRIEKAFIDIGKKKKNGNIFHQLTLLSVIKLSPIPDHLYKIKQYERENAVGPRMKNSPGSLRRHFEYVSRGYHMKSPGGHFANIGMESVSQREIDWLSQDPNF
jgi:hypothetical protein